MRLHKWKNWPSEGVVVETSQRGIAEFDSPGQLLSDPASMFSRLCAESKEMAPDKVVSQKCLAL